MPNITRRAFGALSASALLSSALPGLAQARGRVIVGTWGGDYQSLQQANIVDTVLKDSGLQVVFDPAAETVRKSKILAERRLPRGTMDVACLTRQGTYEMYANGALEELDETKIPNLAKVHPFLRTKYSVPHMYTGRVILYNPKEVNLAPSSYADLWDPKYAGRVGVIDIQYQNTIESAAMIAGGGPSNVEPGKEKLLELKKQGVKIYPTNEAMAQALKSGEVVMCIMWNARGFMWKNAGIDVDVAIPKEGLALYISDVGVPKNAPNKEAAFAYLNAMLDERPQAAFAEKMGYAPPNSTVTLDPALAAVINYKPDQQFVQPDLEYMAKVDASLQSWWEKDFKS
ncbi:MULTISPECIES: ABC transporter substrate-binding protein [unclassified Rhizobium]|uniref:ABC transporter substrate-binding protein n=1 Tax=unclassified Rhizobium TaxID=2613769 RepID=UPI000BD08604|nr:MULTISPECIES: ABC transporter substrate-binding protein [unclassified Rhizobium]MDH7808692.1 putative spermidine/putrescine transport system substrate-binding protein [Rhizobium sp. AN67]SOD50807.1 putative spermidine/putrescine transport system substrate-binding protein [Rhizobium sp. AN6A]